MATVQREARFIVTLDIGTERSGFAYACESISREIFVFYGWPRLASEKASSKTSSAIYYEPGDAATAKVKSWGFAARMDNGYAMTIALKRRRPFEPLEYGTYFKDFKDARESSTAVLQNGFTVAQVISDYLRGMGAFIMSTLQMKYGEDVNMNDVQWCVTLAYDWGDHAMKLMELSMERAGLVKSAKSRGGSPYPLSLVRELEAASYHCLRQYSCPEIKVGDRLLVLNLGNKASHIVEQEVVSIRRFKYAGKQVAASFVVISGRLQLDKQLIKLLLAKVPPLQNFVVKFSSFKPFLNEQFTELAEQFEELRCWFDVPRFSSEGFQVRLPRTVMIQWEQFDIEQGNSPRDSYAEIELMYAEIEAVLKPSVDRTVAIIREQVLYTPNVTAVLVVGEHSGSSYVVAKIKEGLKSLVTVFQAGGMTAASQGATAMVLDEVVIASGGRAQVLGNGAASSSNGDGIGSGTTAPGFSQVLSAHGSTGSSSQSSSRVEEVVKQYSWDQVLRMTNDLTSTMLGKGGFGTVYLGKFENGHEVAVKVLNQSSQQGTPKTFVNEVNLLIRVNHVNLVKLLGYCQDKRDVLIYEFAEEGSIGDHLHGDKTRLNEWKERLSMALQAACGLEYLHSHCSPRIIHRDIKSENILLTKNMVAKVADFGVSRLMGADGVNDNMKTHLSTLVMGSRGYLDPEYIETGRLRYSSDVYSFGIVLLEMITGRKPVPNPDDPSCCIGPWVKRSYGRGGSGAVKVVADSGFSSKYNPKAMELVIKLAISCINHSGVSRPEMSEVVRVLQKARSIELEEKKSWIPFLQ